MHSIGASRNLFKLWPETTHLDSQKTTLECLNYDGHMTRFSSILHRSFLVIVASCVVGCLPGAQLARAQSAAPAQAKILSPQDIGALMPHSVSWAVCHGTAAQHLRPAPRGWRSRAGRACGQFWICDRDPAEIPRLFAQRNRVDNQWRNASCGSVRIRLCCERCVYGHGSWGA